MLTLTLRHGNTTTKVHLSQDELTSLVTALGFQVCWSGDFSEEEEKSLGLLQEKLLTLRIEDR